MRKSHLFSAGGAVLLALAAQAPADLYNPALDYTFAINGGAAFNVTGSPTVFTVVVPDTGGTVVGFSFVGTIFLDPTGLPGQPGQLQLTITAPDSSMYVIGGQPPSGAAWDFQNAAGTANVTYHHGLGGDVWGGDGLPDFGLPDVLSAGEWEFSFVRAGGFPSTAQWSDVEITLHSIPSPGSIALLALAAIRGRRRRGD